MVVSRSQPLAHPDPDARLSFFCYQGLDLRRSVIYLWHRYAVVLITRAATAAGPRRARARLKDITSSTGPYGPSEDAVCAALEDPPTLSGAYAAPKRMAPAPLPARAARGGPCLSSR